jgi:hypothetical protein
MKKIFIFLVFAVTVLFTLGIFAFVSGLGEDYSSISSNISSESVSIENSLDNTLSSSVSDYVKDFVSKKGINPKKISNISQISFEDLPKEVNIENVNDNNLAIYEVQYNDTSQEISGLDKKVFVITYSVNEIKSQGDLIVSSDKRMFLNFGLNKEISTSEFLNTASGVEGSLERGYIMMREGSITGISTVLNVTSFVEGGQAEIIIYKNGKPIGFGNTINLNNLGIKKDYDVQSRGVVSFEPGDLISAYVKIDGSLRDIITLVEITTLN